MGGVPRWVIAHAVVALIAAAIAQADVVGGANVRVSFNGWLTPRALPRADLTPVKLHLKGKLWTSDGRSPPQLRRVVFAINRHGKISTRGLPICRRSELVATTTAQALAACRKALVGSGRFNANIEIPTQAPFPARGRMLAFHSKRHGRRTILAHIFGTDPLPTSRVLTFTFLRPKRRGALGATMSLRLPELGEDWGHVSGFELNLHRRYTYRDKRRSVISASCPAPKGFTLAVFTAAKGTYYLADGRTITRVITGTCKVRR